MEYFLHGLKLCTNLINTEKSEEVQILCLKLLWSYSVYKVYIVSWDLLLVLLGLCYTLYIIVQQSVL